MDKEENNPRRSRREHCNPLPPFPLHSTGSFVLGILITHPLPTQNKYPSQHRCPSKVFQANSSRTPPWRLIHTVMNEFFICPLLFHRNLAMRFGSGHPSSSRPSGGPQGYFVANPSREKKARIPSNEIHIAHTSLAVDDRNYANDGPAFEYVIGRSWALVRLHRRQGFVLQETNRVRNPAISWL